MAEQHFIYSFETPERAYRYSNVAHSILYAGETYSPLEIEHTRPTYSSDFAEARITVSIKQDFEVALNYISHPPPYETRLYIFEVTATSEIVGTNTLQAIEVKPYWKGKIIRPRWRKDFTVVEILCKTLADVYFDKESNNESLHPLCRFFGPADPRCPVDWEDFKETGTVEAINTDTVEPVVTVSGLSQAVPLFKAGAMRAPDGDVRSINADIENEGSPGWRDLTLSAHFPASTLQVGDSVDCFFGDDLTFPTCATIYAEATEDGAAHGGWLHTPNRDPQKVGVQG